MRCGHADHSKAAAQGALLLGVIRPSQGPVTARAEQTDTCQRREAKSALFTTAGVQALRAPREPRHNSWSTVGVSALLDVDALGRRPNGGDAHGRDLLGQLRLEIGVIPVPSGLLQDLIESGGQPVLLLRIPSHCTVMSLTNAAGTTSAGPPLPFGVHLIAARVEAKPWRLLDRPGSGSLLALTAVFATFALIAARPAYAAPCR